MLTVNVVVRPSPVVITDGSLQSVVFAKLMQPAQLTVSAVVIAVRAVFVDILEPVICQVGGIVDCGIAPAMAEHAKAAQ